MTEFRTTPTGKYLPAPHPKGTYWYFVPNPLPPELHYTNDTIFLLAEAQHELSKLGAKANQVPSTSLFTNSFMRKEAEFSCQIEGTLASFQDALEEEAGIENQVRPPDTRDITNYLEALARGIEMLNNSEINLWFIRGMHEIIISDHPENTPGSFRTEQNQIGGDRYNPCTSDFVPPAVFEMDEALRNLESFFVSDIKIPALIKIALAHAQFETIHPFKDGNGRVGRLLITFQLYKENIIDKPVLYLSYFFKKHKSAYHAHLQRVHDEGDWMGWIEFFLQGVLESSKNASALCDRIQSLNLRVFTDVDKAFGQKSAPPLNLISHLFLRPIVSVEDVQGITKMSQRYCYDLVRTFEEMGILKEYTKKARNRKYAFLEYLDLLHSVHT